jgi:maleate isomerase
MADTLGWRAQIAILTTSMNSVVQPECEAMRPPGVTNHIYRMRLPDLPIRPAGTGREGGFGAIVAHVSGGLEDAVREAMLCRPDHLVMAVSVDAVWGGYRTAGARIAETVARAAGRAVGLTQAAEALAAALARFAPRRIGLLSPYSQEATDQAARFLGDLGYVLSGTVTLSAVAPSDIARLPVETIHTALRELSRSGPDVIVQFGGNLPMAGIAAEAERWIRLPVIATNTASYWHALRAAGIADRVVGQGRLLEEF